MSDVTQNTPPKTPTKSGKTNPKSRGRSQVNFDIRDPDAFQDKVLDGWAWVEKNSALVSLLVLILILGGIVYSITGWWGRRQERKAQESYYAVEAAYTKKKEAFDQARLKSVMPDVPETKDAKTPPAVAPTGDLAKDYGTTIDDLAKIAHDYSSTAAGAQAAILASDVYLTYNKPDQAAEIAQVPAHALGEKNLLGNLARLSWGTAISAKGDCKQALEIWKPLVDNKNAAYLQSDASLRSGLCYEQMNQFDDAKKMYEKVVADNSGPYESPTIATAKGLLRALELKQKTPAAAPAKG